MTLPSTGTLTFNQINVEITRTGTATLGLDDSVVRTLAAKTTPLSTIGTADLRGKTYAFKISITANTPNLNLRSYCLGLAQPWNGVDFVEVTIAAGVYIYSTVAGDSTPALTIDGTWANGVKLINNGFIVGRGGAGGAGSTGAGFQIGSTTAGAGTAGEKGGRALVVTTTSACTIDNTLGTIAGGGGGGGGGGGLLIYQNQIIRYGHGNSGGGGGGRSGITASTGGARGTSILNSGSVQGIPGYGAGAAGGTGAAGSGGGGTQTLQWTASGGSPVWAAGSVIFPGGSGGGWGSAGTAGSSTLSSVSSGGVPYSLINAGAGGAAGTAVTGNTYVTWTALGSRLGTIIA